ncbi:MAG: mycofactocin-coupled SDR family oxidoreductase [Actinomycetota bacterium]|nr:mycofactocin-coupled SDR family oxidoreductase [Actinomycetota bacterium]
MSRLEGKVALITGAARGQGRSHAVRLARDGADVIALDICAPIDSVAYPLATRDDLARTVAEVEELDRRIVAAEVDVRDADALAAAVADGVARLGGLDIVLANAGIGMTRPDVADATAFRDLLEVNLVGVWNTVHAALPTMIEGGRGGSIVLTSSVMGLSGRAGGGNGGAEGYTAAKHALVGLARGWARWLAPHNIRVNTVHPAGVRTPMIVNEAMEAMFPTPPEHGSDIGNLLDVLMLEPEDISNAIAWLVSDEARYVTGVALPVDAGFLTP